MTMLFATWHKIKRRLRIANAGQEQPLLCKDGRCEKLPLAGFPLGMYPDVSYEEIDLTLAPGNVIVFYSDGLGDTQSANGRFFGTDHMRDVVASNSEKTAAEIADQLIAAVDEFSHGAPPADDRTLVVLKVLETAPGD
jgi:sigma-B regulation protein RsbU (phosphoserine phosphatase)